MERRKAGVGRERDVDEKEGGDGEQSKISSCAISTNQEVGDKL